MMFRRSTRPGQSECEARTVTKEIPVRIVMAPVSFYSPNHIYIDDKLMNLLNDFRLEEAQKVLHCFGTLASQ